MNVNHDKRYWDYLEHQIEMMWESYNRGDLKFAQMNLNEVLSEASDLSTEMFKGLEVIFNELLPLEAKEILIQKLLHLCKEKSQEAKKEIKNAWQKELSLLTSLKFDIQNPECVSKEELLNGILKYEQESSFGQEIRFQNYKKETSNTGFSQSAQDDFYELYRFVQLESINYNKQFWDYHLDLIHELFENIYPKVRDHNHLTSLLEEADRISPFRREKVFKSLVESSSKYDKSKAAKDNLLEAYFDYSSLIHKIYEEADLEIKRRKSSFHEDFIDEESDVMNSFKNGNQDNYGY